MTLRQEGDKYVLHITGTISVSHDDVEDARDQMQRLLRKAPIDEDERYYLEMYENMFNEHIALRGWK